MTLIKQAKTSPSQWLQSGEPWIWINAAAVAVSLVAVVGLLLLLAVRGFGHFWPSDIMEADYVVPGQPVTTILGEWVETESVPVEQLQAAGFSVDTAKSRLDRSLIKRGNRDVTGVDFVWVLDNYLQNIRYPEQLLMIERREWGNFYGRLIAIKENQQPVQSDDVWQQFQKRIARANSIFAAIEKTEKGEINAISYQLERLQLRERQLNIKPEVAEQIAAQRRQLNEQYAGLQQKLSDLYQQLERDSFSVSTMDGHVLELNFATVVRALQPNRMNVFEKLSAYFASLWAFLSEEPREANTEGGIFPAIFGTVMMVLLMSIMVTPLGVVAAVYMREYAKQGKRTRIIRIAVNNLAGVPSIVYGVFGLGFFIYFVGAEIDKWFFSASLPTPTFGTPGLLWASLTLALLTLPVVIVATEEGLSRIPRSLREGSLALGATKAETLWKIVLPMASPAIMTGLILAVARAAGEVAPLMLVGVVKLAPSLPVDANFPYLHLDQKFMHLGFHIYDVGFQSPNVEAARPLVYATALLLVIIIALLNFTAVAMRNRLRDKYKAIEV